MPKDPFTLDVQKFIDSFEGGAEKTMRAVTIKTWSAIIQSSPVDTGRFRGNWFATGQKPSNKTTNKTDKSGDSATARATTIVGTLKDWSTFTLSNNLPYASHLEFGLYNNGPATTGGYSNQAPQGMVRVNIARINNLLEKEAKKRLPK